MPKKNQYITIYYDVKPFSCENGSIKCLTNLSGQGFSSIYELFADSAVSTDDLRPNNSFKNFDTSITEKIMIEGVERNISLPNEKWYSTKPLENGDLQNLSDTILSILESFEKQKVDVLLDLHFNVDDRDGDLQTIYDECKKALDGTFFMPELVYDFSSRDAKAPDGQHKVTLEPRHSQHPATLI
jgi:hypothetical protein